MNRKYYEWSIDPVRKATKAWVSFVGLFGLLVSQVPSSIAADIGGTRPEHSTLRPMQLKAEHLSDPLGIETQHPRFRWLLESTERAQLQTAYQTLVSSSEEKLQADVGDKWDSGKVTSDNSVEVSYAGRP